jgi:hypothetical protein
MDTHSPRPAIVGSVRDIERTLRSEGYSRSVSEYAVARLKRYPFAARLPRELALRLARRTARRLERGCA